MTTVSIVIPCYYNAMNIPDTYKVLCRDVFDVRKDINFEGTPDMGDNLVVKVHCAYMAT